MLSESIPQNSLKKTIQFLETIEALFNELVNQDRYVRSKNLETFKYLTEAGVVSPEQIKEKIPLSEILKDLEAPDKHLRIETAEILKYLIKKGVIGLEKIKEKISIDEFVKNLSDQNSYLRARNAEVVSYLIKMRVISPGEVAGRIPTDIILEDLKNQEGQVRARNAEAIKYLREARLLSPKKTGERILLDTIIKDIRKKKGYVRARNAETLKHLLEAQVISPRQIEWEIPVETLVEGLKDSGQVRAITTEALKCFIKTGLFSRGQLKKKITLKDILRGLKDSDKYKRAINAEAFKNLIESGLVGPEAVTGKALLNTVFQDARDRDGYVSVRSAEVLKHIFKLDRNTGHKIPLKSLLEGLKNPDNYMKALNAKVLRYLVQVGALNKKQIRDHPSFKSVLGNTKYPNRSWDLENTGTIIYLIELGLISPEKVRKTFLDNFKEAFSQFYAQPLGARFYCYQLRLFDLLRDDNKALLRLENYWDQDLLALSKILADKPSKDFYYNELAKLIRENRGIKDTYCTLTKRLQDFLARRIINLSESDVTIETITGKLLAHILKNKGEIAFNKIKNAFRLLSIEFKDAGNSLTTAVGISKAYLKDRPPLEFKKAPVEPPKFQSVKAINSIPKIDGRSLQSALEDARFYKRLGRTLVYKTAREKFIAIKFLKCSRISLPSRVTQEEREDPGRLIYESKYFDYLQALKNKGVPLKGTYPSPLPIKEKKVVQISDRDLPPEMKTQLSEFSTELKSHEAAWADVSNGYYTIMAYSIDTRDYFTYLHQAADKKITGASERNIHDLFTLARYGLIHPDLIDLFHNLIQIRRPEEGRFLWNVDIIRPMSGRAGAGRLHAGNHAVSYPNMRLSGLADFAEMVSLDDLLFLDHHHSAYMKFNLRRFFPAERKRFLLAYFMGNYLLAWVLIEGKRLKEQPFKLNWQKPQALASLIKKIYSTAYKAFTQSDGDDGAISTLVDWNRFARQMAFFMGHAYKNYQNRPLPHKIFDQDGVYITPGDGWGFIHMEVIKTALKLDGRGLSQVLDRYFGPATSERRPIPPSIFIFKPNFKKLIKGEKNQKLRNGLENLYENYAKGWHFDGINEDLGPVNGPFPLQELIKANYIYTMFLI